MRNKIKALLLIFTSLGLANAVPAQAQKVATGSADAVAPSDMTPPRAMSMRQALPAYMPMPRQS